MKFTEMMLSRPLRVRLLETCKHTPARGLLQVARAAVTVREDKMVQKLDGPAEVTAFLEDLSSKYEKVGAQLHYSM
jgi:hypothetical protein